MQTKYGVIIILTFIALGACGLWYAKNTKVTEVVIYHKEKAPAASDITHSVYAMSTVKDYGAGFGTSTGQSVIGSSTPQLAAEWKTYTNADGKYEFEYPADLFLAKSYFSGQDQIQSTPKYIISVSSQRYPVDPTTYTNDGYYFTVSTINYNKPFDFNNWFNTVNPENPLESLERVKVGGQTAYKYTVQNSKLNSLPRVLVPYNGKIYFIDPVIECYKKCKNINQDAVVLTYDHILSTFKFIK